MPTVTVEISSERVLLRVSVALPAAGGGTPSREYQALVDTGAQCTMVSRRVVDQVGATQVGVLPFLSANGQSQMTAVYELFVGVVIEARHLTFSKGETVPVLLLPFDPPDYDVLLGMDVLTGYHITMWDGAFVLSI